MLKCVGKRIKNIRISKGITQEELAERTNLSITCISRLENEKTMVSLEKLIMISNALETNLSLILYDYISECDLKTIDETQLINQYRQLSTENKKNIQDIIDLMIKNSKTII